jgi:hypothetical protein
MNVFLLAAIITAIFFLLKLAEQRVTSAKDGGEVGLKHVVRNSVLVYASVAAGGFLIDQAAAMMPAGIAAAPHVCTGPAPF